MFRALKTLFIPGGLLFLAAFACERLGVAEESPGVLRSLALAVFGISAALGLRFNRSRPVFALLALGVAGAALVQFGSTVPGPSRLAGLTKSAVAVLLPLNLAALSLAKERGILTVRGLCRIALILAQPLAIWIVYRYRLFDLKGMLDYRFIKTIPAALAELRISQPVLASFAVSFLILAARFVARRRPLDSAFLWALIAAAFTLATAQTSTSITVYFSAAGVVLLAGIIEESYNLAFLDELTGLPTRRSLNEEMQKLGRHYTLAMVDVDFFKKFNDRYGHDVGDEVLRMVASKLVKVTGGGRAFRYGGEEFTVLFPGKTVDDAVPHLETLRFVVESSKFTVRARGRPKKKPDGSKAAPTSTKRVSVTVSIGAAEPDETATTPAQVLKQADKALYRAKKAGRNRISV